MQTQPKSVVSVIIPCYNAEHWVAEAVQSCLDQTYRSIEIIVIDDGSTDGSVGVLRSFGDKIRLESGPNRGGNYARNRGFSLSSGEYIQFLDADDYLLPEKVERQVRFLEETGADVVYGDWRHRHHLADGSDYLQEIEVSGAQDDVLESLLAGWWVSPVCLLFLRGTVVKSGGWDETLKAGQDKDFFISIAMAGAKIQYQPGCHSIYRRYGNVTVSTSNRRRWLDNHLLVSQKVEAHLLRTGRLSEKYKCALAKSYFSIARNYYEIDRGLYRSLMAKIQALDPHFKPQQSRLYDSIQRIFGYDIAEKLAKLKRSTPPNGKAIFL